MRSQSFIVGMVLVFVCSSAWGEETTNNDLQPVAEVEAQSVLIDTVKVEGSEASTSCVATKAKNLFSTLLDSVVPEAEAAACGTPFYCNSQKGNYCGYGCYNGQAYRYWDEKKYYRFYPGGSCHHLCTDSCDYSERWTGGDQYC